MAHTTLTYIFENEETTILLPPDLSWEDESYSPIVQSVYIGVDGDSVIDEFVKNSGRPITLSGGEDRAWIDKATLNQLLALQNIPGQEITLTFANGQVFTVLFDRREKALEFQAIFNVFPHTTQDHFSIKIKFIQI